MSDAFSPSSGRTGDVTFQGDLGDIGNLVVGDQTINFGTIEQLHLNLSPKALLGESNDIPLSAKLAVTLLDRTSQCGAIDDALNAWIKVQALGMVVVLHGSQLDMHRALEERYASIEFGSDQWLSLDALPWPDQGGSIMSILRELRERLPLPKTLDQPGIELAVSRYEKNIFFSHYVDTNTWAFDKGALIQRWIEYLGSNRLHPAPGYRLVAFLCVSQSEQTEAAEPPSSFYRFLAKLGFGRKALDADAMTQFLSGLQSTFLQRLQLNPPLQDEPASYIVAPPPLTMIRRNHLYEWIGSAERYLKRPDLGAHFIDLPGKYFSSEDEELRFEVLFQKLARDLAETMPRQVHFQEKPA